MELRENRPQIPTISPAEPRPARDRYIQPRANAKPNRVDLLAKLSNPHNLSSRAATVRERPLPVQTSDPPRGDSSERFLCSSPNTTIAASINRGTLTLEAAAAL